MFRSICTTCQTHSIQDNCVQRYRSRWQALVYSYICTAILFTINSLESFYQFRDGSDNQIVHTIPRKGGLQLSAWLLHHPHLCHTTRCTRSSSLSHATSRRKSLLWQFLVDGLQRRLPEWYVPPIEEWRLNSCGISPNRQAVFIRHFLVVELFLWICLHMAWKLRLGRNWARSQGRWVYPDSWRYILILMWDLGDRLSWESVLDATKVFWSLPRLYCCGEGPDNSTFSKKRSFWLDERPGHTKITANLCRGAYKQTTRSGDQYHRLSWGFN